MTDKKYELKAETLGGKMADVFAANINCHVTEQPQQAAADASEKDRPEFPSADELGIAFAAAINRAVMEEKPEKNQLVEEAPANNSQQP